MSTVKLAILFDIQHGNKFDLNKMQDGNINFVGRSSKNNGITGKVKLVHNTKPYDAGLITVALGGSVLSSFVQLEKFYTGQNIATLTPKIGMTFNEKVYYCLEIQMNAYRFSTCGREANRFLKDLEVTEYKKIPSWVNRLNIKKPIIDFYEKICNL